MLTLTAPCTVSFKGSDLGRFDRETEIKLAATVSIKTFTKTKSTKIIGKRSVYNDVTLNITTQFDKSSFDSLIATVSELNDEGTVIVDSDEFNITITNMILEADSFNSFGGKSGFNLIFTSKDRFADINFIEK